jgi:hypothetical protein
MSFADKVITFNKQLDFSGTLPAGIRIMNPFKENDQVIEIMERFYKKYYDDSQQRHLILGINPGRFGGGVTGIPFTDSKRLKAVCNIPYHGKETHEPSSVFVYEMIAAFGGAEKFYNSFYINSLCPLGFTSVRADGKEVNYNYYDSPGLTAAVYDFMVENIKKQIALGCATDTCFCFGTGKNEKFLRQLNEKVKFFKNIIALEHPRFIMQYKTPTKQIYIQKYIDAFESVLG